MIRYAIGVGCRRGCPAAAIVRLVREVCDGPDAASAPPSPLAGEGGSRGTRETDEGCLTRFPIDRETPHPALPRHLLPRGEKGIAGHRSGETSAGEPIALLAGLFTSDIKRDEIGLREAAAELGLPLTFLNRAALDAQLAGVVTRSPRVARVTGVPSVAEAAALAGAGQGGRLLGARRARDGATCAVAVAHEGRP